MEQQENASENNEQPKKKTYKFNFDKVPKRPIKPVQEYKLLGKGYSVIHDDGRMKSMDLLDAEAIFAELESGDRSRYTTVAIAKKFGVNPSMIKKFLALPKYKDRTEAARELIADVNAEATLDLMDDSPESMVDVKFMEVKMKAHWWLAEKYNPKRYGTKREIEVRQFELSPEERAAKLKQLEAEYQKRLNDGSREEWNPR